MYQVRIAWRLSQVQTTLEQLLQLVYCLWIRLQSPISSSKQLWIPHKQPYTNLTHLHARQTLLPAIHYVWTTTKKVQTCATWIVHRTWFIILALFIKQFFHISCFITDLLNEQFFDEMSKALYTLFLTVHKQWRNYFFMKKIEFREMWWKEVYTLFVI